MRSTIKHHYYSFGLTPPTMMIIAVVAVEGHPPPRLLHPRPGGVVAPLEAVRRTMSCHALPTCEPPSPAPIDRQTKSHSRHHGAPSACRHRWPITATRRRLREAALHRLRVSGAPPRPPARLKWRAWRAPHALGSSPPSQPLGPKMPRDASKRTAEYSAPLPSAFDGTFSVGHHHPHHPPRRPRVVHLQQQR
jgi:hypothetical protein